MRTQSTFLSAALVLVLTTAVPFTAGAADLITCSEMGLQTWVFHSGIGSGTTPGTSCEAAWNDFASTHSATGSYSISYGAAPAPWDPSVCLPTFSCYTCRPYVADKVDFAKSPIGAGGAGDIAVGVADGVVVKIERLDSGVHGDPSGPSYAVDVLTEDGTVQVLVDGRTGDAARVRPGTHCSSGSCSSQGN